MSSSDGIAHKSHHRIPWTLKLLFAYYFCWSFYCCIPSSAAAAAAAVPLPFSLCGDDLLGIDSLFVNEYPIKPGSDIVITANYTPQVTVTGGKAVATVHILGIPLSETRDVCAEPGVQCPLVKGKTTITQIRDHVPGLTPSLSVDVKVNIADQSGRALSCIETKVQVHAAPLIGPLAYQIGLAMEQYIRLRPSIAHPLLRGSSSSSTIRSSGSSSRTTGDSMTDMNESRQGGG